VASVLVPQTLAMAGRHGDTRAERLSPRRFNAKGRFALVSEIGHGYREQAHVTSIGRGSDGASHVICCPADRRPE
jgi:hypothetical protein